MPASGSSLTRNGLDGLRRVLAGLPPLEALGPVDYAAGHALFEARSDQRARLTSWLVRHLAHRAAGPTRVLSIGCGDGSVDVRLAAVLAGNGHRVEYVGVEPHPPSARACRERLDAIPGVHGSVLGCDFADARPTGSFDVVLAVHSLYYVADLATTLRRMDGLRPPGGELVILHAPYGALNRVVRLLAPGRRQEFSDEVAAQLRRLPGTRESTRIENRLDLTETGNRDVDRQLLEFTVQARLPPVLLAAVRDALAEQALPGPGLVVSHPVDALVLRDA